MTPLRYLFIFAIFLHCGCGSVIERSIEAPKLELPSHWVSAPSSELDFRAPSCQGVEAPWWEEYLAGPEKRILQEVFRSNPDLRIAAMRVSELQARSRLLGADQYPSLGFGGNGSRRQQAFVGLPIPGASDNQVLRSTVNAFGVSLNLSWELDLWGQISSRANAAQYELEAGVEAYKAAVLSLVGQTVKLISRIREAQDQVRISELAVSNRKEFLNYLESRFRLGLSTAAELHDARAKLARSEATLLLFHNNAQELVRQLEILLGDYPSGKLTVDRTWPETLSSVPAGLPATLLERRPDILAAQYELLAAEESVDVAELEMLPKISLSAGGGTTTNEFEEILNNDFRVWSLAANLTQPLFQGGRILAGIDAATAAREREIAEYVKQVLLALYEVEAGLEAERLLASREQALFEETTALGRRVEFLKQRYRNGTASRGERMSAIFDWLERRREYSIVRANRISNRIDLHLALGGGYQLLANRQREEDNAEEGWWLPLQVQRADLPSTSNSENGSLEALLVGERTQAYQCRVS